MRLFFSAYSRNIFDFLTEAFDDFLYHGQSNLLLMWGKEYVTGRLFWHATPGAANSFMW